MPELTKQQQSAVEDRGGALLVSAAAGSGKTKVLVERLFRYVTVEGRNIDDFLIITYTRAAAAELRGKIAAELSLRMAADPGNTHLHRGRLLCDAAAGKYPSAVAGGGRARFDAGFSGAG